MQTGLRTRFAELDVLRGLAAACVVLSHYSSHRVRYFGAGPFGVHLGKIYGFYAVEMFFMISGFFIYLTLERSAAWQDFAFSRVTRLYPRLLDGPHLDGRSRERPVREAILGRRLCRELDDVPGPSPLERSRRRDGPLYGGTQPTDLSMIDRRCYRLRLRRWLESLP
jgi:hypothetical protein